MDTENKLNGSGSEHLIPGGDQQHQQNKEQVPGQHEVSQHVDNKTSIPAPMNNPNLGILSDSPRESVPVVKVWSIRGVEYAIMSFMLWFVAIAINWVVVALINGESGFVSLSPPLALMIVSIPIFAFFFLRLKKAELADPRLKTESTKRRFSQITQIVSFIVTFSALLTIVGSILASIGGESNNLGKTIGTAVVFIVVWGALFAYYWVDEHRNL